MLELMRSVLVLAAHPDDEVLGCGGTIARLTKQGVQVKILFLADGESSRGTHDLESRRRSAQLAADHLGAAAPIFLDFPDNRLDSVPLLDVVQAVEQVVAACPFDSVFTHHAGDLNVDHRIALQAALTAFRPLPGASVKRLLSFEILSASHWAGDSLPPFIPNVFIDIGDSWQAKLAALNAYTTELRPEPHARSLGTIDALSRFRGGQVGLQRAEAFQILRVTE